MVFNGYIKRVFHRIVDRQTLNEVQLKKYSSYELKKLNRGKP